MFDICVNLHSERFTEDHHMVINRAFAQGIEHIALTGSCLESSQFAIEYAKNDPNRLCTTVGIHPHSAKDFTPQYWQQMLELTSAPSVKAIGECGLDYFRNLSDPAIQKDCFMAHIALAKEQQKPLFLHQRDAFQDFIDILDSENPNVPIVVHCFTDGKDELQELLNRGYFVGITGWICDDRRNHKLVDAVKTLPLDKMMIETDSPWLTPRHLKKIRRNEPAFLHHVVERLAKETGHSTQDIIQHSTRNAREFFGI